MTRFIHDQFAKDYLEELLKDYGKVEPSKKVASEIQEIDVLFTPFSQGTSNLSLLGLLGKFAEFPAMFEPFRNPASGDEICDCLKKLLEVKSSLRRDAKAKNLQLPDSQIPKLWILTPTASSTLLAGFNVTHKENWLSGIHFLGDNLRTAIVAIHQLPKIPETLWLRVLGRGKVQEQAILELQELPTNHPYQQAALELVYNLRENLRINQNLDEDDTGLIMRLEPIYQRNRELAKQEGRQEGLQEGLQEGRQEGLHEGRQEIIIRLLSRRFGNIDNSLIEKVQSLSIEQLDALAEALLDFTNINDLEVWLNQV